MGITKTGATTNNNNSPAVYNHFSSTGHPLSLDNFDIISRANNNNESPHIPGIAPKQALSHKGQGARGQCPQMKKPT